MTVFLPVQPRGRPSGSKTLPHTAPSPPIGCGTNSHGRRRRNTLGRLCQQWPGGFETVKAGRPEAREVDATLVGLARRRRRHPHRPPQSRPGGNSARGPGPETEPDGGHLRPTVMAGEEIQFCLVQVGRAGAKGAGFLDDRNMVVVDAGRPLAGQLARVAVTRVLPIGVGCLVFAVPEHAPAVGPS